MFFGRGNKGAGKRDPDAMTLVVVQSRCPQNHVCPSVRVCPVGALRQKHHEAPTVEMSLCIKCGKCVKFCPMKALVLQ